MEFLFAKTPLAPLMSEPRASATQISQLLHGHYARVIKRDGSWAQVCCGDGYEGWLHEGYTAEGHNPLDAGWGWDAAGELSLGCSVRDEQGDIIDLPLGALIGHARRTSGRSLDFDRRRETFPREAEAIVASAMGLFQGTYYQWGGISPWGADCSGLVQSTYALHGVKLPRDAWQQAEQGVAVEGGMDGLKPADLLFFSDREDGRITHVAMSTGSSSIVHAALGRGGHCLERLEGPDKYSQALVSRFRFARRILD